MLTSIFMILFKKIKVKIIDEFNEVKVIF